MANGFQFLAQSVAPNILGAFEQGRAQTRQAERERVADQEMRAQLERGNQFRQLAGQAYGAQTPQERHQFVAQAAAADPQSALALDNQFAARDKSQHELMMERMGVTAGALVNAPEQMRPMLYKSMLPELRKFMPNAPEEYDPGMIPVAQQFLAARSGQPASVQAFQQMTQGMKPDEIERARRIELGLEPRAISAGVKYMEVMGPDGRTQLVALDPRQPGAQAVGGGAFTSLTPAEKAAQEAQAKADVELRTQPQISAATTAATAGAESDAKRRETQRTNQIAFDTYTQARNNLEQAMAGTTTGPVAGRLPAMTTRAQIAEGAQATMAPLLKQIFRTAGEGTFTDRDQELLLAMVPTRTDHPEAARAKLSMIDQIVAAKFGVPPAAPAASPAASTSTAAPAAGGQPVRVSSPQEAMSLPPGTQFLTPDGRVKVRP